MLRTIDLENVSDASKKIIETEGLGIANHTIELTYDYWTSGMPISAINSDCMSVETKKIRNI